MNDCKVQEEREEQGGSVPCGWAIRRNGDKVIICLLTWCMGAEGCSRVCARVSKGDSDDDKGRGGGSRKMMDDCGDYILGRFCPNFSSLAATRKRRKEGGKGKKKIEKIAVPANHTHCASAGCQSRGPHGPRC